MNEHYVSFLSLEEVCVKLQCSVYELGQLRRYRNFPECDKKEGNFKYWDKVTIDQWIGIVDYKARSVVNRVRKPKRS